MVNPLCGGCCNVRRFLVCGHQLRFVLGRLRQPARRERKTMVHWRLKLPTLVIVTVVAAAVFGKADALLGFFW